MASFAQRLLQRRTPLSDITGFAGGNLQDQLDENGQRLSPDRMSGVASSPVISQQTGADQMLTPTNQANITRPRGTPQGDEMAADPNATRTRYSQPLQFDQSGKPSPQPYDYGANPLDVAQKQYDAAQVWGGPTNTGFKARMKAGWHNALMAPPGEQRLGAFVQGVIAPKTAEKEFLKTKAATDLGQQLNLQKEKAQIAQMGMVWQRAPDGSMVQVPIKSAGQYGLGVGRLAQGQTRLDQQKARNDAYIGHLESLPKEKQSESARKIWLSGVADGNEELKTELQKRMGLSEALPDSDKGSIQTDADGNYTIVHARGATADPVTTPTTAPDGTTTQTPVASFKKTQELGKDQRSRLNRAAAMDRTIVMARATSARLGDPTQYETLAQQADKDAADALEQAKSAPRRQAMQYQAEAEKHKARATQLRVLATKAQSGQGPIGTQAAPTLKGRTMSQQNFDKYKKDHGDKAAQDLLDGGVTIRK